MSTYSSTRITSTTGGRNFTNPQSEKQRVPSTVAGSDVRPPAQNGYGVNGSDRRANRRDPFGTGDGSQHRSARPREASRLQEREDGARVGSVSRRSGVDVGRGAHSTGEVIFHGADVAPLDSIMESTSFAHPGNDCTTRIPHIYSPAVVSVTGRAPTEAACGNVTR